MTNNLVEVAFRKAKEVLGGSCSPLGSMAAERGCPQVWARDSVITSLGLSLLEGYRGCLRRSLETLKGQQSSLGAIPNNVSVATGGSITPTPARWIATSGTYSATTTIIR